MTGTARIPFSKDLISLSLIPASSQDDDDSISGELSEELSPLQDSLRKYARTKYPSEATIRFSSEEPNNMTATITHQIVNQRSKYAGEWQSHHSIQEGTCTSTVTVVAHLFEEGNFQLMTRQSTSFDRDDSLLKQIDAFEAKVQADIEATFEEEAIGGAIKRLRRHLPLTRSKIDW